MEKPNNPRPLRSERAGEPRHWLPKLDRQERLELGERIRLGADGGVDFVVMMCLSAALVSLGLLQGSTAVVIGAMLVAPLMGPLVGAGMGLVQGNRELFFDAVRITLFGASIGVTLALVFGVLNPGYEPSLEVEARGNPDLLDFFHRIPLRHGGRIRGRTA